VKCGDELLNFFSLLLFLPSASTCIRFVFVTVLEMFSAYTLTNNTKGSEIYVTNTVLKSHMLKVQTNSGNILTQFALLML